MHDLRWGDRDQSGTVSDYVWVFLISGSAPPAHFGGWQFADGHRQPAMYFPNGGSTLRGVSKPGEIVWSRIYVAGGKLHADIGRALSLFVLPLDGGRISRITRFAAATALPPFGLPRPIPW